MGWEGGGGGRHSWAGLLSWREGKDQQASSPPAWRLTCCGLPTSCCGRRHDVRLHMTCRGEGSGDHLMVFTAEMPYDSDVGTDSDFQSMSGDDLALQILISFCSGACV